jgi:hypothetical protein
MYIENKLEGILLGKVELLKEKRDFLNWVISLEELDDHIWFQPFSVGKWATADVVSHFITWDRFFLEHRMPYILKNIPFNILDIDPEEMNREAASYARSGISKHEIINEFKETRYKVIHWLEELPEESYGRILKIGTTELTLISYLKSHHQHDVTHKQQILNLLRET